MSTRATHLRGLTLLEAMLLLVILSIVAVAAGVGLQAVAKVPSKTDDIMAANSMLVSAIEQLKAGVTSSWPTGTCAATLNFNGTNYPLSVPLNNAAGASTPVSGSTPPPLSINGKPYVMNVAMANADPGVGSVQPDFLQLTVTIAPLSGTAPVAGLQQKMVCYVTQP